MTAALSDLKHGIRVLVRTPLFTLCTIAALAIGIGSTTALFSVVNAMLIQPLPHPNADRLLVIWEHNLPRNRTRNVVNVVNFMGWRDRTQSFEGMGALQQNRVTLTGSGEPMELSTIIVTANLLDVVGAAPAIGRGFLPNEDQATSQRTMVLSHGLWVRQFGGDAGVLGTRVTVDGEPVVIIGVMPPGFELLGQQADALTPFRFAPVTGTGGRSLVAIGRMKPGVTRDQAQAELESVMTGLRNERPDFNTGWT
ncbi:MAG TPA: ABC transporter permease, partial [Vicinamibacterales bacterium]